VSTSDIFFSPAERSVLASLPEYTFLKEDVNYSTGRRALRNLIEGVVRLDQLGVQAFVVEVGRDLNTSRRCLRPHQAAELQVLVHTVSSSTGYAGAALAEFSVLANALLPATAYEQLKVARLTRPECQRDVDEWRRGALVETRLGSLPVRFEKRTDSSPHESGDKSSNNSKRRGRKQGE
jgi:hypothetical protein